MSTLAPLACPKCRTELKDDLAPPGAPRPCPSCGNPLEGLLFPAYLRPPSQGKQAEALIAAEDAGCFYHPQSRAQSPCDICGRFLCALCDIEINGQHLCPACVNTGRKKKQIRQLDEGRILYGGIALLVAILPPVIMWFVTPITAPLAIFLAIYGWNKPQSITGARRAIYIAAILVGLMEIAFWILFFIGLLNL